MRRLEQSSDTVRRRSARTNQAVQEHEQLDNTVRRGMRRLEQSSDIVRRCSTRTNQAVQEHEQSSNTVRTCSARTNQAVREINLKSEVALASSKAKGDHLNNEGQEEPASKNDSEDLYKDSFFKPMKVGKQRILMRILQKLGMVFRFVAFGMNMDIALSV